MCLNCDNRTPGSYARVRLEENGVYCSKCGRIVAYRFNVGESGKIIPVPNYVPEGLMLEWKALSDAWKELALKKLFPKILYEPASSDMQLPIYYRRVRPCYYTKKEGGEWVVWPYGNVDLVDPLNGWNIKDHPFHALAFGEVASGHGKFPRWDIVRGWDVTFLDAFISYKRF